MANEPLTVLAFIANASQLRETYYRNNAAHLRDLAEAEPLTRFRKKLLALADQFEALADMIGRRANGSHQ